MAKVIKTNSLEETYKFAEEFIRHLTPTQGKATVLALYGNLGSGKTSFTQGVAKAFGFRGHVISPTFVIEKIYRIPKGGLTLNSSKGFKNLIHIDAYRLDSGGDLLKLGWLDVLNDSRNLVIVEWSERVESVLSDDAHKIEFEFIDENVRKIKLL